MGHITTEYINTLSKDKPSVFIETGTFKGGIPQLMLEDGTFNQWEKIYTIELNEEMCKIASKRYSLYEAGQPFDRDTDEKDETFNGRKEFFGGKLVLIQGDSGKKLKDVLSEINEPCVFWLDAHAGAKEGYARGEVDCPLIEELDVISNHNIKNHIITVDDADLLGQIQYNGGDIVCDYSDMTREKVESMLKSINSDFSVSYPEPFGQSMLVSLEREVFENQKIKSSSWFLK
jgi:hypothetical protein